MKEKSAAHLLENQKFSRSEIDKVIEMTLNKETNPLEEQQDSKQIKMLLNAGS